MIEVWRSDEYDFDETEYLKDYQQYLEEIRRVIVALTRVYHVTIVKSILLMLLLLLLNEIDSKHNTLRMYCFWMLCYKSWMPSIEVFPVTTSMWKWNRNSLEQERISSNSFCHSPWEHLMIRIVTPFDSLCPSCGFYSRINRVWWDTSNYSLQWFKMLPICISGSFIERS